MKTVAFILAACLALTGCEFTPKKPDPKPAAPVGPTQAAASALSHKEQEAKTKAVANIAIARKANGTQPETPAKATVEGELALAVERLDVQPDPVELLAGEQRARALAEGRTEEARKLYADALRQANEDAKARAKAEADLKAALAEASKAEAKYKRDLADLEAQYKAKIEAARSEVLQDQVKWFNRAGAACAALSIGVLGLCLGFGGVAALRVAAPFAAVLIVGALSCFGLAQIVGAWWFKWAVLSLLAVGAAVVGAWFWRHARQGNLKQEAESRAVKYKQVLRQVVPVLDDAYEQAEAGTKKALDRLIFSRLSSLMNTEDKAVVHTIRADKN